MAYKIPRDPAWCSRCIAGGKRCDDHVNGVYNGPDVYEATDWVLCVVGKRYRSWDGVFVCFGYDPREGFWMECVLGEKKGRLTNVSERAIGRTFHEVKMTWGSFRLLRAFADLGRAPAAADVPNVSLDLAAKTLTDLGCIDASGITDIGRVALEEHAPLFT